MLIAVAAPDRQPQAEEILGFFSEKVAKWQVPDRVIFVESLPRNATGKVLKRDLRKTHADALAS